MLVLLPELSGSTDLISRMELIKINMLIENKLQKIFSVDVHL